MEFLRAIGPVFNFLLLALALVFFTRKQIRKLFQERRDRIADALGRAADAQDQARHTAEDIAEAQQAADAEAHTQLAEAKAQAEANTAAADAETAREAEAVAPQGIKPGTTAVEVIIREGRKNQVKRMLSKIHHPVIRLHRCNFAGLELKDVAKGSWRELTDREVQILKSGGIPPKQASAKRNGSKPQDTPASRTRHHGSHGSAPKRNTYRERYTG